MSWFDAHLLVSSPPWTRVAAIVVLSYLLEDGALILAAALAAAGSLSVWSAWGATFVGIFSGDLGIYMLARSASRVLPQRSPLAAPPGLVGLMLCRFTPGLRTVAYAWCGITRMPLERFAAIVFGTGLAWTLLAFTLLYQLGIRLDQRIGDIKWMAVAAAALLVWFHRIRRRPSETSPSARAHD